MVLGPGETYKAGGRKRQPALMELMFYIDQQFLTGATLLSPPTQLTLGNVWGHFCVSEPVGILLSAPGG